MTRPASDFNKVLRLFGEGHNDSAIARLTGIPRHTVRDWRTGVRDGTRRPPISEQGHDCWGGHDFNDLPAAEYSYLLGMYLGDGCLSKHPRGVWRLRIVCDSKYTGIINECCLAIEAVMPGQHAYVQTRPSRCVEVGMYSKHWVCMFPQHAPGRKHERPIHLEPWQQQFVDSETKKFLRGLIHSDGCRVVANDRGVRSVRYHFSNLSEDIKRLYCAALDRLEIPWTRPSDKDIAVYRKAAVAQLDEFIGPKQ